MAWDRRGGGSRLYSCHTPLGMAATCCAICFVFRQAGSVFTYGTEGNTSNEPAVSFKTKQNIVIVLSTCSLTHREGRFPYDLKLTLCQLSHITVDNKDTRRRDRERELWRHLLQQVNNMLAICTSRGRKKERRRRKGREPRPSANGGSNLRVMKA